MKVVPRAAGLVEVAEALPRVVSDAATSTTSIRAIFLFEVQWRALAVAVQKHCELRCIRHSLAVLFILVFFGVIPLCFIFLPRSHFEAPLINFSAASNLFVVCFRARSFPPLLVRQLVAGVRGFQLIPVRFLQFGIGWCPDGHGGHLFQHSRHLFHFVDVVGYGVLQALLPVTVCDRIGAVIAKRTTFRSSTVIAPESSRRDICCR